MPITDLIPWKKREPEPEGAGGELQVRGDPFLTFQQRMNQMFDEFFQGSGLERFGTFREGWGAFSPCVDMVETDSETWVSMLRLMTNVVARIRNSEKMTPPTHQIAPVSPPTNTRSNSGFSIQDRIASVEPSITISTKAADMRGQCGRR